MAEFLTDVASSQTNDVDYKRQDGIFVSGTPRVAIVKYTADGTQAATDTIKLVRFGHPVIILPQQSYVHVSAAMSATACTIDIGDDPSWTHITPDPDRYADGLNAGSAGIVLFTAPAVPAAVGTPYFTTKPGWLTATIATLTGTASSSAVLTFYISYLQR